MRQGVWIQIFFPAVLVIFQFLLATARGVPAIEKEAAAEAQATWVMTRDSKEPPLSGGTLRLEAGGAPKEIDRYQVLGELGHGAMGVVYKGRDPIIDRWVAIKTIRFDRIYEEQDIKGMKGRFFKEAQAAGKLTHPNIVTIFDVGEDRGLSYMAMEYVEGDVLSKNGGIESCPGGAPRWQPGQERISGQHEP